jgi:hypothetical protein
MNRSRRPAWYELLYAVPLLPVFILAVWVVLQGWER